MQVHTTLRCGFECVQQGAVRNEVCIGEQNSAFRFIDVFDIHVTDGKGESHYTIPPHVARRIETAVVTQWNVVPARARRAAQVNASLRGTGWGPALDSEGATAARVRLAATHAI